MRSQISVQSLSYSRGIRPILKSISLKIAKGQVIGIMGPSGCGKTTLMHLIAGQLRPQKGTVQVFGVDIHKLRRKELLDFRRNIGFLFQSGALFTDMNVFENLAFPLKIHYDLSEQEIKERVMAKLEAVGLKNAYELMPRELSGGMNRRVALARAIIMEPQIMIYDEPFTGQDPISKGVLMDLIRTLNDQLGMTSIMVSHDIPETLRISDYVYVLGDSKIVGQGEPKQLLPGTNKLQKQLSKSSTMMVKNGKSAASSKKTPKNIGNKGNKTNKSDDFVKQFLNGEKDGPIAFHYSHTK